MIEKKLNKKKLPIWTLSAKNKQKGIALTARLDCYARTFWNFNDLKSHLPLKVLNYNEYPCVVTDFLFKNRKKETTLKDLGLGVGNSEHTWGSML